MTRAHADGSAFCAVEDEHKLRAMGFMDSKQLTESKRDALWAALQKSGFIGWKIRALEAKEISEGMLRKDAKCVASCASLAPPRTGRRSTRLTLAPAFTGTT